MKFTLSLCVWATLMLLSSACTKEVIKEVVKTDTLEVIKTDTLIIRDTVCASDSCLKVGLRAYYPFSGNFKDASGNGFDLTGMNGVALGADTSGKESSSALLDGIDDYLFVNDAGALYSDQFTISLLFKAKAGGKNVCFSSHHNYDNATGFHFNNGMQADMTGGLAVGKPISNCTTVQNNDPSIAVATPDPLTLNTWHSYIGIFDNGKIYLYIDGKLVASKTPGYFTSNNCTNARLTLGSWWKSDPGYFNGYLDEYRIYNRALSPCEIDRLSKMK